MEEESEINTARVDVYNAATDTWSRGADMPFPLAHVHQSTIVMNGKILTFGGEYQHNYPNGEVMMYDPASDVWSLIGFLPSPRRAMVAGCFGNQLIATGGYGNGLEQSTTWICTPII